MDPKEDRIPFPKRVFFIIGNEFCERFNYYGMKTILSLYLKYKLGYSEDDATILFHLATVMVYVMCLFGGILSDVWLGKFKTILYLSIVYLMGSIVTVISSIPVWNLPAETLLLLGLFLIAVGSGGIKACVSAFSGDQFKLPEQAAQFARFFSMFYFAISLGSLLSTTFTPILRQDVHCFGSNDCFPLAFGVPAILMVISIVFFIIGKSSYTFVKQSSENMLLEVTKCITNGISMKICDGRKNPKKHFLDYSIEKHGEELVSDTKAILNILVLYLPLPLFWALYDQQGSRWTFQATRMNGNLGFYTIKPDQMHMANPLSLFIFIPLFESVIYPILNKIGIRGSLQKMVIGLLLAALAFFFAGFVQFQIESLPEQSVHMLWLLPQYIAITLGEVMFAISGLSFSYENAPLKMRSVVMAFWYFTVTFGDIILIIITKLHLFKSQAHEFLLYSGLMLAGTVLFAILAYRFKNNFKTTHQEN